MFHDFPYRRQALFKQEREEFGEIYTTGYLVFPQGLYPGGVYMLILLPNPATSLSYQTFDTVPCGTSLTV